MAAIPAVEQVLQEWDIKQTDVLLEKLEADRNTRQEQEKKLREAENNRLTLCLQILVDIPVLLPEGGLFLVLL